MKKTKQNDDRIRLPKWTVKIPGWREFEIENFHIEKTYRSFLEGTTHGMNRMLIAGLEDRVRCNYFGLEESIHILAPYTGKKPKPKKVKLPLHLPSPSPDEMLRPFPPYFCFAMLFGPPVTKSDPSSDDAISSYVYCGWFADDIYLPAASIIQNGVRRFDWDSIAENCEPEGEW